MPYKYKHLSSPLSPPTVCVRLTGVCRHTQGVSTGEPGLVYKTLNEQQVLLHNV